MNARRPEGPGHDSLQITSRKAVESWTVAMETKAVISWLKVYRTSRIWCHKEPKGRSSMLFCKNHQMWSTLLPLSWITTEWTWRASFLRTNGKFLVFLPTPLNDAFYESGELTSFSVTGSNPRSCPQNVDRPPLAAGKPKPRIGTSLKTTL